MFDTKKEEKHLKKLNVELLNHLEEALRIMSITKCPYFIIEGYGAIYMDKKYIKRKCLSFDQEEIDKIKTISKEEKKEYCDERIEFIAREIKALADMMSSNKTTSKKVEPKEIKVGTTLNDLLEGKEQKKLDISLEKSNEIIETIPNITKEQAIEQVKFGQKTKNYDFINDANKSKAKSKIEEYYKSEDKK